MQSISVWSESVNGLIIFLVWAQISYVVHYSLSYHIHIVDIRHQLSRISKKVIFLIHGRKHDINGSYNREKRGG